MSLSKANLASVQKAGEAVFAATQLVEQSVRTRAASLTASMAANPMGAEVTQALEQFRLLATLSQDLRAVEAQMRVIYAKANELARPEADVVMARAAASARLSHATDAVSDVVAKPAPATKPRQMRAARKAAMPDISKTPNAKTHKPQAMGITGNDNKLLAYLQNALTADGWTALNIPLMAQGSQLPAGSVGASLKRLLALGKVRRGERGMYQRT